jgi:hypothetical protein
MIFRESIVARSVAQRISYYGMGFMNEMPLKKRFVTGFQSVG